jgi:hypothetical protein
VFPLYHLSRNFLMQTSVHGWEENLLDTHPLNDVWLDPRAPARPLGTSLTR